MRCLRRMVVLDTIFIKVVWGKQCWPVIESVLKSWSEMTGLKVPVLRAPAWSFPSQWQQCWRQTSVVSALQPTQKQSCFTSCSISKSSHFKAYIFNNKIKHSYFCNPKLKVHRGNTSWGIWVNSTFLSDDAEVLLQFDVITGTLDAISQTGDRSLVIYKLSA